MVAGLPIPNEPKWLYHYTNTAGLTGILASRKLWLTDIEFLNDHKEFHYFTGFLSSTLSDRASIYGKDKYLWIEHRLNVTSNYARISRVFVASFSTESDSLSQWRGYSDGTGFNLRFDFNLLNKFLEKHKCELVKVEYDSGLAKLEAERIIEKLSDAYDCKIESEQDEIVVDQMISILGNSAIFKNSSFKEEREWRIIKSGSLSMNKIANVYLRPGRSLLIPYTDLDLINHVEGCSLEGCECQVLINRVNIGPGQDKESQKKALQVFRLSNKRYTFSVGSSSVPFRGL